MAIVADVIIIGAGVVGCSIAYQLAKKGCNNIVVLEKKYIGSGSTENCAGGIRQQFSTEVNIKLSLESVRFFEGFEEETGHTADFKQNGYLILATTEEEIETFKQSVALQRRLGVDVSLLTPREAQAIVPCLNIKDVLGASYCPTDGYADPYSVVHGFASSARKLRVKIYQETEVIEIKKNGHIWNVLADKERFQASIVVIATGAWSGQMGRIIGRHIPVIPSKRHIFVTTPINEIVKDAPMVVDFQNGFWFRREGQGLIFGMRNPDETESFDTSVDWGFLHQVAKAASFRLPFLMDTGVVRAQAGLHDDTPDANAIISKIQDMDDLYLACGFSGHGFMHSPAVGRVVADLIIKGETSPDISTLALDRFNETCLKREKCFI